MTSEVGTQIAVQQYCAMFAEYLTDVILRLVMSAFDLPIGHQLNEGLWRIHGLGPFEDDTFIFVAGRDEINHDRLTWFALGEKAFSI
jgi:hypothetical protein